MRTGIEKLDDLLNGNVPENTYALFLGEPTVEGDIFVYQIFYNFLAQNREGIFVAMSRSPRYVFKEFESYGWNMEEFRDHVHIVDGYSMLIGAITDSKYIVKNPNDISSVISTINLAIEEHPDAVIAIPSISTLIDYCTEKSFISKYDELKAVLKRSPLSIASFVLWPYKDSTIEKVKDADCLVAVKGMEHKVVFAQYFSLERARWIPESKKRNIMFKTIKPGGIRAYIPKILITGAFNAGKSTFIHTLSSRAVSVDRLGTTIALDHGHIDHKGIAADIFGTPGQERFDALLNQLSANAMGVVVMVDSTKPETFNRAKDMCKAVIRKGMSVIFAANKQDLKGALSPAEMHKTMNLPEDVKVVSCISTKKESVVKVFEELTDQIMIGGVNVE